MIDVQHEGEVAIAQMDAGENRLSPAMLDAFDAALGDLETADGPRALVTVGTEKFFSNGLDLDHLGANPDDLLPYLHRVHSLFARLLRLPCATVAAMNGHTFAAGAMLAICHDHRVMRVDRGYWCLPEVDLGMPFTPGMNALIPARVPAMTAHRAMVTGHRYGAQEALDAGIVDELATEADVLPRAVEVASGLAGKAGPGIGQIRAHLHQDVIAHLLGPEAD